jgi:acetylornithine deacetylase/succinyl-diaminopimelate desuccinylase-like protein
VLKNEGGVPLFRKAKLLILCALCVLALCPLWLANPRSAKYLAEQTPTLSTVEQLQEDLKNAPCRSSERLKAAQAIFTKMGAMPDSMTIESPGGIKNLVVKHIGNPEEIIVVGAHYDKTLQGCGAIDNWTGIVTIAHIFKTLKETNPHKTILFIAFGDEEEGMLGSKAMVSKFRKEDLGHYCAMINIDSLGMTEPHVATNMSTKQMQVLASEVGKIIGIPVTESPVNGGDSDSSSFADRKIPALTIDGLTRDWSKVLHTANDQTSRIDPKLVYRGYKLTLALIDKIDNSACNAFR